MSFCNLCPRNCNADRTKNYGFCGVGENIKIAKAALHMWEEPCISGKQGSGTIFFSGCSLGCVFCQNNILSHKRFGKEITSNRLLEIFYELKEKGAHNINLVTADHYIDSLIPIIKRAKAEGFDLPFILNTSSYLKDSTILKLKGLIDIFIADFKFFSPDLSKKYASAYDYPEIAKRAIDSMFSITDPLKYENGMLKSGIVVRVLVLPGNIIDSKLIIKYLLDYYSDKICLSVMNQYTPAIETQFNELNRKLKDSEYKSVVDYALKHGFKNGYIQQHGADDLCYIPDFNLEGV